MTGFGIGVLDLRVLLLPELVSLLDISGRERIPVCHFDTRANMFELWIHRNKRVQKTYNGEDIPVSLSLCPSALLIFPTTYRISTEFGMWELR